MTSRIPSVHSALVLACLVAMGASLLARQASPPPKSRERVRKRFSRPLSSENMPPRPGTTSMIRWVCCQYSNCARLM